MWQWVRRRGSYVTQRSVIPVLLTLFALLGSATANAQANPAGQNRQEPAPAQDLTGTNPLLFLRTVGVRTEYQDVPGGFSNYVTTFNYLQPLQGGKANLNFRVPLVANDFSGKKRFGIGDASVRYNFLPRVTFRGRIPVSGVFVGVEHVFDTASRDEFGRGKNIIQAQAGVGRFLPGGVIVAPAVQYSRSYAGDSRRGDVNQVFFDLYAVKQFGGKNAAVLTLDPSFGINFANGNAVPVLVDVQYQISPFGPGQNLFIRPSVGLGKSRPYNWSVRLGYSLVGF
jgi:hypothetical protein